MYLLDLVSDVVAVHPRTCLISLVMSCPCTHGSDSRSGLVTYLLDLVGDVVSVHPRLGVALGEALHDAAVVGEAVERPDVVEDAPVLADHAREARRHQLHRVQRQRRLQLKTTHNTRVYGDTSARHRRRTAKQQKQQKQQKRHTRGHVNTRAHDITH